MSEIIKPGSGVLFMKVGTHAQEKLEEIIRRKSREIEETGYGMWGYGGKHLSSQFHGSTVRPEFCRSRRNHSPHYGGDGLKSLC